MAVEFALLGEVEARIAGGPVDLGHARQRSVLAVLAVEANRIVSADQLLDRVWGDQPPSRASGTLRTYLSRLRRLLEPGGSLIVRRSGGYILSLDDLAVDLNRFRRLVAEAGSVAHPGHALGLLDVALALWRGEAFATLDTPWLNEVRTGLDQERHAAELDRAEIRLLLGHHTGLVTELSTRATAHPLDERLAGQLMLALYRSGRQADALGHYEHVRRRLADELGADPSPPLRELHRQILTADPALTSPAMPTTFGPSAVLAQQDVDVTGPGPRQSTHEPGPSVPVVPAGDAPADDPAGDADSGRQDRRTAVASVIDPDVAHVLRPAVVPRQVPAAVTRLVGRASKLAALTQLMDGRSSVDTAVVASIDGTAGVGKTALALSWAHQVRDRFPDGQLYVDLRGFGPAGQVMDPAEAIHGFLDALGVPPGQVPPSAQAQIALYRSLLDGKRILVLLDNARDAQQVRPLLPATAGAMVIVTSRDRLSGLVAVDNAHPIGLDLLGEDEAGQLLRWRLGHPRAAAEPHALQQIVNCCARLPLALTIVAARATQTGFSLATLAAELAEAAQRLDALSAGDPASQVRTVFSWSYTNLTAPAARLFRLLGLHPGPDISVAATASLIALPPARARALLAELTQASLLTEHAPGRYTLHDLLQVYAAEQAEATDSDQERHTAELRILDHYLHTAHAAARVLDRGLDLAIPAPTPGVIPEQPSDENDALAWFAAEHTVLPTVALQQSGPRSRRMGGLPRTASRRIATDICHQPGDQRTRRAAILTELADRFNAMALP